MNEFNTRIAESLGLTEDDLRSFVFSNPPQKTDLFTRQYIVRADGERSLTVKLTDITGYEDLRPPQKENLWQIMDKLFDDKGDGYHQRAVDLFDLTIENFRQKLFPEIYSPTKHNSDPIKVFESGEGMYSIDGGRHRFAFLRMLYMSELKKCGDDPEKLAQLEELFTIPVITRYPIDYEKTYEKYIAQNIGEFVPSKILQVYKSDVGFREHIDNNHQELKAELDQLDHLLTIARNIAETIPMSNFYAYVRAQNMLEIIEAGKVHKSQLPKVMEFYEQNADIGKVATEMKEQETCKDFYGRVSVLLRKDKITRIEMRQELLEQRKLSFVDKILGKGVVKRLKAENLEKELELAKNEIYEFSSMEEALSTLMRYIEQVGNDHYLSSFLRQCEKEGIGDPDTIHRFLLDKDDERFTTNNPEFLPMIPRGLTIGYVFAEIRGLKEEKARLDEQLVSQQALLESRKQSTDELNLQSPEARINTFVKRALELEKQVVLAATEEKEPVQEKSETTPEIGEEVGQT